MNPSTALRYIYFSKPYSDIPIIYIYYRRSATGLSTGILYTVEPLWYDHPQNHIGVVV